MTWKKLLWSDDAVVVRKNSGANIGTRPRLNFIEGSNISLAITDDAGGDEVDISVAVTGIESGADITDATNVAAAGAVMRSSQNTTLASNGTITPDGSQFIRLETYGGAATDNLDHVYLTNYEIGDLLTFSSQDATHDVTIRDNATGGGGIYCEGNSNFTLTGTYYNITFIVMEIASAKKLFEYRRFNG